MRSGYVDLDAVQSSRCVVNQGKDDELVITGYKSTLKRTIIFRFMTILTLGLLRLWIYWKPSYGAICYKQCPLIDATIVSVENTDGDVEFCEIFKVETEDPFVDSVDDDGSDNDAAPSTSRRPSSWWNNFAVTEATTPFTVFGDLFQDDGPNDPTSVRYVVYRELRLVYNGTRNEFSLLIGLDGRVRLSEIVRRYLGWTKEEQSRRLKLFGTNAIDVHVSSYFTLFYKEILNPFYVFQMCSLVLWLVDNYYIYAVCILLLTFITIGIELHETREQIRTLRDMASAANESTVMVRRRDGVIDQVDSADLTPGDIIVIPPIDSDGFLVPCDVVLLNGFCIVDESILTGESAPVYKTALTKSDGEDMVCSVDSCQKHALFCGTRVIQARFVTGGNVFGLVVRTGFASSKGSLIRSVLYPKAVNYDFFRDAALFLYVMALIAVAGTTYSLTIFLSRGMHAKKAIVNSLDIITIVVPPTLPAALSVGIWYSQRRLKAKQIYSTNPQRITLCGKLNLICFDKTGTLTEDELELNGVLLCNRGEFSPLLEILSTLPFGPFLSCLVTCHNLTVINGQLTGESLDLRIFEATKWEMDIPAGSEHSGFDRSFAPTVVRPPRTSEQSLNRKESVVDLLNSLPLELGIVRQFPFSSDLRRCTVVARQLGAYPMTVFCKGAPEQIVALCNPKTIPADFKTVVDGETLLGRRVLALAYRTLPKKSLWHHVQRMKREDLERDLEFLGLIVFHNPLKPPTTAVIDELKRADIRCVMVTGDSLLTSLCVARDCHIINEHNEICIVNASVIPPPEPSLEVNFRPFPGSWNAVQLSYQNGSPIRDISDSTRFVLSGPDFALLREHSMNVLKEVVSRGVVFARMRPLQKAQLVEIFQELGYVVGMCGDGANDCSALKAADAGISLSDLEASVSAPFTCRVQTVDCVPVLIKEGRCALETSFGVFKYMMMYSMIQFVSVIILYSMNLFFADYMYLFIDLFIITVIAIFMGRTGPSDKLDRSQPSAKLFSLQTIFSLQTHLVVIVGIQLGAFFYLRSRIWYGPVCPHPNEELSFSWETTTIFFISCFQYLIMALVFASGPPHRKPFYSNLPFVCTLVIFSLALAAMLFLRIDLIDKWLELIPIPHAFWRFQLTLILLVLLNLTISLLIEFFYSPRFLAVQSLDGQFRRNKSQLSSPQSIYISKASV